MILSDVGCTKQWRYIAEEKKKKNIPSLSHYFLSKILSAYQANGDMMLLKLSDLEIIVRQKLR